MSARALLCGCTIERPCYEHAPTALVAPRRAPAHVHKYVVRGELTTCLGCGDSVETVCECDLDYYCEKHRPKDDDDCACDGAGVIEINGPGGATEEIDCPDCAAPNKAELADYDRRNP